MSFWTDVHASFKHTSFYLSSFNAVYLAGPEVKNASGSNLKFMRGSFSVKFTTRKNVHNSKLTINVSTFNDIKNYLSLAKNVACVWSAYSYAAAVH